MSAVDLVPFFGLVARRLDRRRAGRIPDLLEREHDAAMRVLEACQVLDRVPDTTAARTVDEEAARLLLSLRGWERLSGPPVRMAERLDRCVYTDMAEILDRERVPTVIKRATMRLLHHVNDRVGSYEQWTRMLGDALGSLAEAHVHDLAAGTGGFATYLARHPPVGRRLELTSSDLDPGYVAIGAERARRAGLEIHFEERNALSLRDARDVDLFVCTQATHHLGPGAVVRMIHQAIHVAPRGLLIIDLYRALSAVIGTTALIAVLAPFPPIVIDGMISVRRGWLPCELELLARIAGAKHIRTRSIGPVHCALHARA